jgi:hypothetical protein
MSYTDVFSRLYRKYIHSCTADIGLVNVSLSGLYVEQCRSICIVCVKCSEEMEVKVINVSQSDMCMYNSVEVYVL